MWLSTELDSKLKKYLERNGINPDTVKAVHAFWFGYNFDEDGLPLDDPKLIHHRIFSYDELKPEYEDFFREYHRFMVIFRNGGNTAWDIFPQEWERIDEILTLELSSAE